LRRHAESKLQEINAAHTWLEANPGAFERAARETPSPGPDDGAPTGPPPPWQWPVHQRPAVSIDKRKLLGALAIVVAGSILVTAVIATATSRSLRGVETTTPTRREPSVETPKRTIDEPTDETGSPTFTLGATRAELFSVQGTPTKVQDWDLWVDVYYGRSSVKLKDDRVVGYNNEGNLRVDLATRTVGGATRWTIGSTLDDVVTVEGTPTAVEDWSNWMSLRYGRSTIKMEGGRVAGYYNDGSLDVFVTPGRTFDSTDWAVGSPLDEVVSVQGTPTAVEDWESWTIFYYGRSYVRVRGGRVVSYDDADLNLSVRSE